MQPVIRDAYWSWMEERVLAPIKEQDPSLYSWILDMKREQVLEAAELDLTEKVGHEE